MANRLIFLYHVVSVMTDGGTGKGKGTQAMVVLGQARSQSLLGNPPVIKPETGCRGPKGPKFLKPCLLEKRLGRWSVPVPKPTQVGR